MNNELAWQSEKPEFKEECLLLTAVLIRGIWEYTVYQIAKVESDEEWYMGWLTGEGEEYGDLEDLKADKYLVMPLLKNRNNE
jgi:hypothetical protein